MALKGMTVAQAATTLGMSEGTARVTLHRGLKVLAKLYRAAQP
ncbi:sigma factor-like helix-turn-helix DNA-binding protein [Vibrio parahaemolyticus]